MSRLHRAVFLSLALTALVPALHSTAGLGGQTPSGEGRISQPARVVQRLGPADVTVVYNRPTARGRALFGGLVPWDSVWNPGADEATRIELSDDLTVAGQRLPAGRYSIWVTPRQGEWTVEFNSAWDQQHRPCPRGSDVLRIRVAPEEAEHMESLAFYFPVSQPDEAVLALHWGETRLAIPISSR